MVKTNPFVTLGLGAFGLFAALGGLVLLISANQAAPGCTGPKVERCDYVATATNAAQQSAYPFKDDLGTEVFDLGSAVIVEQFTPAGEPELNHASSVLIDKASCRVCEVGWHRPTPRVAADPELGQVIQRLPARDEKAAAVRARRWHEGPGGIAPL